MVAAVDEHDPPAGGDRPRVAVGHPRPGKRQAQPPQAGEYAFAAAELSFHHDLTIIGRTILATRRLRAPQWPPLPRSPSGTSPRSPLTTSMRPSRAGAPARSIAWWAARIWSPPTACGPTSPSCSTRFRTSRLRSSSSRPTGRRTAVRWRATGTFAGPGTFQGFSPNHARIAIEGCDVITVEDELIVHNDAFIDTGAIARQLGLLPPAGSSAEARLAKLANLRTRVGAGPARRRDRADRRRGLGRPRRLPDQDDERLPDRGRRRRHRVRRRDLGDGRRPARRLRAPRRRPADRARPRRRRPPRRGAGTAGPGLLPSRRAGGRRVRYRRSATTGTWPSSRPTRGRTTPGCCPRGTEGRSRSPAP